MKVLRAAWVVLLVPVLCAQTDDAHAIIAASRQRVESTDFSASGHLVWVRASGIRISYPIKIKAHWFPGVLRIKAELGSDPNQSPSSASGERTQLHALIEMHPGGENEIWIAHPGDKSASVLPFNKWSEGPLGSAFSYEDFLEQEIFWPGQTFVEKAKFGTRNCDVVKSTPGSADKTHYAEVKSWFDPTIEYPVYVEKTAKETGAVKEFTSFGLRREGRFWAARQIEMKTRGQSGSTLLVLDRGTPKANLTLNDFNLVQLTHF
jgi:hypothetical protein